MPTRYTVVTTNSVTGHRTERTMSQSEYEALYPERAKSYKTKLVAPVSEQKSRHRNHDGHRDLRLPSDVHSSSRRESAHRHGHRSTHSSKPVKVKLVEPKGESSHHKTKSRSSRYHIPLHYSSSMSSHSQMQMKPSKHTSTFYESALSALQFEFSEDALSSQYQGLSLQPAALSFPQIPAPIYNQMPRASYTSDEAMARRMQAEVDEVMARRLAYGDGDMRQHSIADDEALARRLAAQDGMQHYSVADDEAMARRLAFEDRSAQPDSFEADAALARRLASPGKGKQRASTAADDYDFGTQTEDLNGSGQRNKQGRDMALDDAVMTHIKELGTANNGLSDRDRSFKSKENSMNMEINNQIIQRFGKITSHYRIEKMSPTQAYLKTRDLIDRHLPHHPDYRDQKPTILDGLARVDDDEANAEKSLGYTQREALAEYVSYVFQSIPAHSANTRYNLIDGLFGMLMRTATVDPNAAIQGHYMHHCPRGVITALFSLPQRVDPNDIGEISDSELKQILKQKFIRYLQDHQEEISNAFKANPDNSQRVDRDYRIKIKREFTQSIMKADEVIVTPEQFDRCLNADDVYPESFSLEYSV